MVNRTVTGKSSATEMEKESLIRIKWINCKENVNITKGEQIYEKFHKWRIREKRHTKDSLGDYLSDL